MNFNNKTITLTFGDRAENHVGMQIIGKLSNNGFTHDDLLLAKQNFENKNCVCELINLKEKCDKANEDAYILIIRNGVNILIDNANDLFNEHSVLDVDKKAFMYGRVVNKKARHNLCFSEISQEPDYKNGQGRLIAFNDVPLTQIIRNKLPEFVGGAATGLQCEGNYYYDNRVCGIGYHTDNERKKVIGVRIGATMPLCYVWYYNNKPCSNILKFNLNHGDIYIMSEFTTGNNCKKKNIYTLRHSAGCDKYTNIENVNVEML